VTHLTSSPHPEGPTAVYLRTLCFVFRRDRVLLIQRQHPPDEGYWNAPGGKIERGEDPLEAAQRELKEETGLEPALAFRGVATVVVRSTGEHWTIFLFTARVDEAAVARPSPEGALRWFHPDDLTTLPVLPDLPLLLPRVKEADGGIVFAKFVYATPDPGTLESSLVRSASYETR
jgi:8-oxo-dGTP diphosphatase